MSAAGTSRLTVTGRARLAASQTGQPRRRPHSAKLSATPSLTVLRSLHSLCLDACNGASPAAKTQWQDALYVWREWNRCPEDSAEADTLQRLQSMKRFLDGPSVFHWGQQTMHLPLPSNPFPVWTHGGTVIRAARTTSDLHRLGHVLQNCAKTLIPAAMNAELLVFEVLVHGQTRAMFTLVRTSTGPSPWCWEDCREHENKAPSRWLWRRVRTWLKASGVSHSCHGHPIWRPKHHLLCMRDEPPRPTADGTAGPAMPSPAEVRDLLGRVNCSSVVSADVVLHPIPEHPGWHRGPCPFHPGQHHTLRVFDDSGWFSCPACGAQGDAISWLRLRHYLLFVMAIDRLRRLDAGDN